MSGMGCTPTQMGEMVFLQVELLVSWLRWLCPPAQEPWTCRQGTWSGGQQFQTQ